MSYICGHSLTGMVAVSTERKKMKITDYVLNITREDVATYYELKLKKEERKINITLILIITAIFVTGPFLVTRILIDIGNSATDFGWFMDILIIQNLIIILLTFHFVSDLYATRQLCKLLSKYKNLSDMVQYVNALGKDNAWIHIAFILHFKQYLYSYVTDNGLLVIAYRQDENECYYTTCEYKRLCDENCQNAVLNLNNTGIYLTDRKQMPEFVFGVTDKNN